MQKRKEDRAKTRAIIDEHITKLISQGVPVENIIIGGFSEGAIVAVDYILEAPENHNLSGLVFLSGSVDDMSLAALKTRKKSINAFISHGKDDNVLGIDGPRRLIRELSKNKKNKISSLFFDGGHQITHKVITKLGEFLKSIK